MNPTRIDILGEDYFVFSHSATPDNEDFTEKGKKSICLLPSLLEDFRIIPYRRDGKEAVFDPAYAVAAAAHLTLKRGMPLSESVVEAPDRFCEIFCTGDGYFEIEIPKCKILFTNSCEVSGCMLRYTDVLCGAPLRLVRVEDIGLCDASALRGLVFLGNYLPSSVCFFSEQNGFISLLPNTSFNPDPPSLITHCAAAAFTLGKAEVSSCDGRAALCKGHSSVKIKVKCEIK